MVNACRSRKSKTFLFPREKRKKTWKVCTAVAENGQESGRIKKRKKTFAIALVSPFLLADHSLEYNDALKPRRRGSPHFSPPSQNRARAPTHNFCHSCTCTPSSVLLWVAFPKKKEGKKKGTAVLERGLHACKREGSGLAKVSPLVRGRRRDTRASLLQNGPSPLSPFLMILLLRRAIYCRPPTLLALMPPSLSSWYEILT